MLEILLAAVATVSDTPKIPSATLGELKAEVQPFLDCDRRFDEERYVLTDKLAQLYAVASKAEDAQRLDFNWETNRRLRDLNDELGSLEAKIVGVCQRDATELKLKMRLFELRSAYRPWDVTMLSRDLIATFVRLERDLAKFNAGKFRAPDPPMAPSAPRTMK